jgi:ATP-dependent RNA helicase DBP3
MPTVLVVSPTRELAMQIEKVVAASAAHCGMRSLCIFGGVDKYSQKKALRAGVDVVAACPGRLLDLIEEGCLSLSNVDYVVLDEADRMLDMGFEHDVRRIMSLVCEKRQTLMFSATWPVSIQKLASEFLDNPIRVTIGSEDLSANHSVKQIVQVVQSHQKDHRLIELLENYHRTRKNRVLIFALYKKEASRLETMLNRKGWTCVGINGDKSQESRSDAIEKFRSGAQPLLVATDVAARGLDIPNVEYVINYTFPLTVEEYVHRIGRTGRAGKTGVAHTFFTVEEKHRAGELANVLREADQDVPEELTNFGCYVKKKEHSMYGAHFRNSSTAPMPEKKHIKFG